MESFGIQENSQFSKNVLLTIRSTSAGNHPDDHGIRGYVPKYSSLVVSWLTANALMARQLRSAGQNACSHVEC